MSSISRRPGRSKWSRWRAMVGGRRLQVEALEQRNLLAGFLFTVTTELDVVNSGDGVMSLREAVAAANAAESDDTISFSTSLAGKSVKLTGGQITIADSVAIDGLGVGATTVQGQGGGRLFDITNTAGDVTFNALTLTEGFLSGSGQQGGAIRSASAGQLKLLNCLLTDNSTTSGAGGGVFASGDVTLNNSTIKIREGRDVATQNRCPQQHASPPYRGEVYLVRVGRTLRSVARAAG